jgi:hypothetical protein
MLSYHDPEPRRCRPGTHRGEIVVPVCRSAGQRTRRSCGCWRRLRGDGDDVGRVVFRPSHSAASVGSDKRSGDLVTPYTTLQATTHATQTLRPNRYRGVIPKAK